MRLAVLTPPLPVAPWSITPVVEGVVRGLVGRGHEVVVVSDSVEDGDRLAGGGVEVRAFREFSQTATDFPGGLRGWAAREVAGLGCDASFSFSRRLRADVVWPLDASVRAWLAEHARVRSWVSLGAHLVKHRRVGMEVWRRGLAGCEKLVTYGPRVHAQAARALGMSEEDRRLVNVPRFSLLSPAREGERARVRREVRGVLGIEEGRAMLVISAPEGFGKRLRPMVRAMEMLVRLDAASAPVVVGLVRDTFSLQREFGAELREHVRVMTLTEDVRRVLMAADYAVAPFGVGGGDEFASAARGRWVTDALWMGTPVIAVGGAAGADLLEPTAAQTAAAGFVVERETEEAWAEVLMRALGAEAIAAARGAVDRAAMGLGFGEAVGEVEGAIGEAIGMEPGAEVT